MTTSSYYLGIDIGGTFTDLVILGIGDVDGVNVKVLTTPSDPVAGVVKGIAETLELSGVSPAQVARVVHATTLPTNLVLERKGARVAYVCTAGYGDMFHLSRQYPVGRDRFNAHYERPEPFVERELVFEVSERIDATGQILVDLTQAEIERIVQAVEATQPEAVAICLLHAWKNPRHEEALAEEFSRRPSSLYLAVSSEIWPQYQEYERAATALISAYVGPVLSRYLLRLGRELNLLGLNCPFEFMQSNGCLVPAALAAEKAVCGIESGPAAGVIAAARVGSAIGLSSVLSFDMGGTTAKIGTISGGEPTVTHDFQVGSVVSGRGQGARGEPIKTPVIDVAEVGAGGGSIAWIDSDGTLQVGPASAGSDPGPASYGLGGDLPTLTDANLILGFLGADSVLGGSIKLDLPAADDVIARHLSGPQGLSVVETAAGIHMIANTRMASALRLMTLARGIDPREHSIVAFGGAGPVHAVALARQFGIERVIVPPSPGVMSAFGLLLSDVAYEDVVTQVVRRGDMTGDRFYKIFGDLERAIAEKVTAGQSTAEATILRSADIRFVHQLHDSSVPVPPGELADADVARVELAFREHYQRAYGIWPDDPLEFVSFRVKVIFSSQKPSRNRRTPLSSGVTVKASRPVYFDGAPEFVSVPVYDRRSLPMGHVIEGPAIIEEPDSTSVCPPDYKVLVDEYRNLLLSVARST